MIVLTERNIEASTSPSVSEIDRSHRTMIFGWLLAASWLWSRSDNSVKTTVCLRDETSLGRMLTDWSVNIMGEVAGKDPAQVPKSILTFV